MRSSRFAARGQALYETVIFVPLLLFSLVGILWSVRAAVQYERIEQTVRYAGLFQETTPYTDFSLAAMYSELGTTVAQPPIPCTTPIASQLSDGAPYAAVASSKVASPPIFTPSNVTVAQCNSGTVANPTAFAYGVGGSTPGTTTAFTNSSGKTQYHVQVEDDVLSVQHPFITAQVAVPAFLQNALGTITNISSTGEYFEHGVNTAQLMFCYNPSSVTSLNSQVNYSTTSVLSDPTAVATATPFPAATPPSIAIEASGKCTYMGPT